MEKILWLRFGGSRLHSLKIIGVFLMFASAFQIAGSFYSLFVTLNQAGAAFNKPDYVPTFFTWSLGSTVNNIQFTREDFIGVSLKPVAELLFWIAMGILSTLVYQAGSVFFPIEEREQNIAEHHRKLIQRVAQASKMKKR
ncbi:Uncharacterised protein [uncultured archaeon]|nr:Uncharacterised protein [uncultured archaeon]